MKPYYECEGVTIYHGDCLEILPQLPAVDVVITDPPYGCGKAEWDSSFPTDWYRLVSAAMVVTITGSPGLKDSIRLVGDDFVDVIAARNLNGMTRGPLGFGNWLAAVVAKGKPRQGVNAFEFAVGGEMPDHPSPKPEQYMRRLVGRLTVPGHVVLDPFAGSGTTLLAAKDAGCRAIGIELDERHCETAAKRLGQQVMAFA